MPRALDAQRLQLAWQEADARGERAHLRDRARFELMLLHDPTKANASARASFQDRNEAGRCAAPGGDRCHDATIEESLRAVRAWQQRYRYEDVRLDNLLGARAMRKLLAVIVLLFACGGAFAHTSGSSFLALRAQDASTVHAEWDFDIRDLHQSLQLDEDGDGALTWAEIIARATRDRIARARAHTSQLGRRRVYGEIHGRSGDRRARRRTVSAIHRDLLVSGRAARRSIIPDGSRSTRAIGHCSSTKPSTACARRRSWAAASRAGRRRNRALRISCASWSKACGISITGYDHLAFLGVLLLALARRPRSGESSTLPQMLKRAFAVITAFTLAHSLTLALAATGYVRLPSQPVEVAIALSVMIAALLNISRGAAEHGWKLAFAFGLVHGLGFAGALAELASGRIDLLALAAFNVGIETAQVAIAAAAVPLIWWLFRGLRSERVGVPLASVSVACVAAVWVGSRLAG